MPSSLAESTREAVRSQPFLQTALRAGVLNYTAAARYLPVEGDPEAVATALRRYANELPAYEPDGIDARVRMQSGVGPVESGAHADADAAGDALLSVGGLTVAAGDGAQTAIIATGSLEPTALAPVLQALEIAAIEPTAAAVGDDTLLVIVDRRAGVDALRTVESALESASR